MLIFPLNKVHCRNRSL